MANGGLNQLFYLKWLAEIELSWLILFYTSQPLHSTNSMSEDISSLKIYFFSMFCIDWQSAFIIF